MAIKWREIWARKYSPFIADIFMNVYLNPKSLAFFGWSKNKIFIPKGGLQAFYFSESEFSAMQKNYIKFLFKQNLRVYSKNFENECKSFFYDIKTITERDFKPISNLNLAKILKRIADRNIKNAEWQYLVWFVVFGPALELEQKLAQNPNKEALLNAVSTPEKLNKINKAREELLKQLAKGKVSKVFLENYAKKYAWLPVYEHSDKPWSIDDFAKQIIPSKEAERELTKIRLERQKHLKLYKNFIKTVKDKEFKKLVEIVHTFAYIKEMRDDYRRPAYYLLRPMWQEIAKRLNLTIEQANYLTAKELVKILSSNSKPDRKEIAKRQKNYALTLLNGKLKIYSGSSSLKINSGDSSVAAKDSTSGTTGYKGNVTGTVKIISHQNDFSKFKKGDILVSNMTHPEFMPLIRIAKAIVTDEGGLTCHAAIVAREMKKPCVIGTKNATKIFKDGDIIEVDANKGIIKKIKYVRL